MSIHTKTSLKSVKKGDLVQMFLDQQAKLNIVVADLDDFTHVFDGNVEMKDVKEENEKLESKLDECRKSDIHLNKCIDAIQLQYIEVKEENEKLKEEMKQMTLGFDGWMGTLEEYKNNKEENEKLKEENDKLEEELLQSYNKGNDFIKQIKKLKKEKKYAEKCCQENFGCMIELGKENDKLKEVCEDKHNYSSELGDFIDKQKEEKDKLKEEVKELTKYCEISTIIADMEVSDIYEHAEITDAERLCELGWADKDDFACLR